MIASGLKFLQILKVCLKVNTDVEKIEPLLKILSQSVEDSVQVLHALVAVVTIRRRRRDDPNTCKIGCDGDDGVLVKFCWMLSSVAWILAPSSFNRMLVTGAVVALVSNYHDNDNVSDDVHSCIADTFQVNVNDVEKMMERLILIFLDSGIIHESDIRTSRNGRKHLASVFSMQHHVKLIRRAHDNALSKIMFHLSSDSKTLNGNLSDNLKMHLAKAVSIIFELIDTDDLLHSLDENMEGISLFKQDENDESISMEVAWDLDTKTIGSSASQKPVSLSKSCKSPTENVSAGPTEDYRISQWKLCFCDERKPVSPTISLLHLLNDLIHYEQKVLSIPHGIMVSLNVLLFKVWESFQAYHDDDNKDTNGKADQISPHVNNVGDLILPSSLDALNAFKCKIISEMLSLFYVSLQHILEKEILSGRHLTLNIVISFLRGLFAACAEAILYLNSYDYALAVDGISSSMKFPYVLDLFEIDPIEFLLASEPFASCNLPYYNNNKDGIVQLPPSLLRHFGECDHQIVSTLMWKQSGIWTSLVVDLKSFGDKYWPPSILSPNASEFEESKIDGNGLEVNTSNNLNITTEVSAVRCKYVLKKLFYVLRKRTRSLCTELCVPEVTNIVMKLLRLILCDHFELLMDRHVDQILMCCIYACAKVARVHLDVTMRSIIDVYRDQILSRRMDYSGRPCNEFDPEVVVWKVYCLSENTCDIIKFYNKYYLPEVKHQLLQLMIEYSKQPIAPTIIRKKGYQRPRKRLQDVIDIRVSYRTSQKEERAWKKPMAIFSFGDHSSESTKIINEVVRGSQSFA